jgi:hypothetical protein
MLWSLTSKVPIESFELLLVIFVKVRIHQDPWRCYEIIWCAIKHSIWGLFDWMCPRIFALQRVFEQALNVVTKLIFIKVFWVCKVVLYRAHLTWYPVVNYLLHSNYRLRLGQPLLLLPILFLIISESLHHFDRRLFGARSRVHEFA